MCFLGYAPLAIGETLACEEGLAQLRAGVSLDVAHQEVLPDDVVFNAAIRKALNAVNQALMTVTKYDGHDEELVGVAKKIVRGAVSLEATVFSTFFLNRTNRSGIIHKSGVIGGKQQDGTWKIDARYNKGDLISRIFSIAEMSSKISLSNMDAAEFIKDILPEIPKRSLVYFDPPYYVKGQGLYLNHYIHEGHENMQKLIASSVKQNWIVSYDNAPEIKKMYSRYPQLEFSLNYSAQKNYKGTEVMIFKNGMVIPEYGSPNIASRSLYKRASSDN